MTEVPAGWTPTTLGKLGRYLNGRGFKKSEWAERGRPIIRIQNLTGTSEQFNYFSGEADDRYVARPGDLLVSWAATLGAFIWHGPEAVVNQHIFKVESNIDVKFHKYLLDAKLDELMRETHGSGMVHITRGKFDAVPVLVPSIDDQRRTVEILEDHLSRLDAASSYLSASERRAQTLLASWSSANLAFGPTVEMSTVGRQVIDIKGGWSRSRAHITADQSVGVPYLKMNHILNEGGLSLVDVPLVTGLAADVERFSVRQGDLLFNSKNSAELVGKVGVVPGSANGWTYNENIMRIRFSPVIQPEFAAIWMSSPVFRRHVAREISASTNVAAIYMRQLRELPMPVPAIEEQHRLVEAYDAFVASVKVFRQSVAAAEGRQISLRRSLLKAAFSGQLAARDSRRFGV